MKNDYECPRCHNIFPSENKILHDIRCTKENPLSQNHKIEINNKNNQNPIINNKEDKMDIDEEDSPVISNNSIQNRINSKLSKPNISESNDFPNVFICNICGAVLQESAKNDHLLCHNIEQREKELLKKNVMNAINEQKKIEKQLERKKQMEIEQQKKIEAQIKMQNEMKKKTTIKNDPRAKEDRRTNKKGK